MFILFTYMSNYNNIIITLHVSQVDINPQSVIISATSESPKLGSQFSTFGGILTVSL